MLSGGNNLFISINSVYVNEVQKQCDAEFYFCGNWVISSSEQFSNENYIILFHVLFELMMVTILLMYLNIS